MSIHEFSKNTVGLHLVFFGVPNMYIFTFALRGRATLVRVGTGNPVGTYAWNTKPPCHGPPERKDPPRYKNWIWWVVLAPIWKISVKMGHLLLKKVGVNIKTIFDLKSPPNRNLNNLNLFRSRSLLSLWFPQDNFQILCLTWTKQKQGINKLVSPIASFQTLQNEIYANVKMMLQHKHLKVT